MKYGVIAAAAALAIASGAAQAQGLPPGYNSSQPHPQWSQAERQAAGDPASWFQHLFGGSNQQPTSVASNHARTGAAASAQD